MSRTVAMLFNTALILLEDCMLLLLANGFFSRKRSSHFLGISFAALAILSCVFLYFFGDITLVKIALSSALFTVWLFMCYETSWYKAVFAVVFWAAYLLVGDSGLLTLISAVMGKSQLELMSAPNSYYFLCFTSKAAELLGIVILYTWLRAHNSRARVTMSDWLRVIIFPTAMLAVSTLLLRIYYYTPEMSMELTVCNAIILLVDFVSVFLMNYLERQQEITRDNIILRQSMKTQLSNVEAWRKAYEGQRKQTHDFQNQLLLIHGLVQQQAPKEKIIGYIDRLQHIDVPSTMIVKTHRAAVDIIISQKYAIAESRKIRFITQLDDLSSFPLPDDEIIIVLSNLIDNAIEACEKIEKEEDRTIELKMRVETDAAFLHIENATALPVRIYGNHIISTKSDPIAHGYGLQNVISVLEQCGSLYLLEYHPDKKTFSLSAQFAQK